MDRQIDGRDGVLSRWLVLLSQCRCCTAGGNGKQKEGVLLRAQAMDAASVWLERPSLPSHQCYHPSIQSATPSQINFEPAMEIYQVGRAGGQLIGRKPTGAHGLSALFLCVRIRAMSEVYHGMGGLSLS